MQQQGDAENKPITGNQQYEDAVDEHLRWTRQRTLLANERNFHGWVRTGLTAEVAGLGIARLLHSAGWLSTALAGGVVLISASAAMFLLALRRYWLINRELKQTGIEKATPTWMMIILVTILVASAILAFLLLFQE